MDSRRGVAATIIAIVGLALVIVEAVQTVLRTESLATLGEILLYVGLAGFVIGAAILITDQPAEPVSLPLDGS